MRKTARPLLLLVALFAASSYSQLSAADKPNVIIVITDDQGYGDLSCHGNPVLKTPNLDSLHAESLRLVDYHVSPTCSPTRAALMTGHWTNRTGVWHTIMGRSLLRENETTMGDLFGNAGYKTAMFGKWHMGDNYPFRPEDRGFDEVLRHGGGGVGQAPDYWDNAYFDGSYWHNGEVTPVEGFCTDVFFKGASDFIRQQADKEEPFFVYLATNAPHGPMHAPPKFSQPYEDLGVGLANFYGMIANIDQNVGQLRTLLADLGIAENTIFIFTTDNGTAAGAKTFSAGMRGSKGSEFDGGHRVPFFLHWPAGGFNQPIDVERLTAHVDVLPTLIELCGLDAPDDVKFDGRSIMPLLRGEVENWPDRILVTDSQRVRDPIKWRKSAVMTDRWRLINGKQLFDMRLDPGQERDVATGYPQVVQRLTDFYEAWWRELEPSFAEDARIYIGHPAEPTVHLSSHDWITSKASPWNQGQVRNAAHGKGLNGFWNIQVHGEGTYRFELRRWPEEVTIPISESLPAGDLVPGQKPYRANVGKALDLKRAFMSIGKHVMEKDVDPSQQATVFEVELSEGPAQLTTRFVDSEGEEYGAYYVLVSKLD